MQYGPDGVPPKQQREQDTMQKLEEVAQHSQELLAKATSVFPLDFFPSTIAIDRSQVSVIKRTFVFAGNVTSIRIEDILNVTAQVGPFFGTARITTRYFETGKDHIIPHLWRRDALRVAAILNGMVVAKKNRLDISNLNKMRLLETLIKVGESPIDTQP